MAAGGHSIPEEVIRRRYERGRRNFVELYLPLCQRWIVYDNSEDSPTVVAQQGEDGQPSVFAQQTWNQIIEG